MKVCSPSFSRKAWARFLRKQGCSIAEVAAVLGVDEIEAARLCARAPRLVPQWRTRKRITQ